MLLRKLILEWKFVGWKRLSSIGSSRHQRSYWLSVIGYGENGNCKSVCKIKANKSASQGRRHRRVESARPKSRRRRVDWSGRVRSQLLWYAGRYIYIRSSWFFHMGQAGKMNWVRGHEWILHSKVGRRFVVWCAGSPSTRLVLTFSVDTNTLERCGMSAGACVYIICKVSIPWRGSFGNRLQHRIMNSNIKRWLMYYQYQSFSGLHF